MEWSVTERWVYLGWLWDGCKCHSTDAASLPGNSPVPGWMRTMAPCSRTHNLKYTTNNLSVSILERIFFFLPLTFRSMREGNVFTPVCTSTEGGGRWSTPALWSLVLFQKGTLWFCHWSCPKSCLESCLGRGRRRGGEEDRARREGYPPEPGQGYNIFPARTEVPLALRPPPLLATDRRVSVCYNAGSTLLAVTQEECLVLF